MKTIQVYDPAMCCSTGICGPNLDPGLINFAALLSQMKQRGVKVERYNLAQQPTAFIQNPTVKALLEKEGPASLPLILLDGEIYLKGRYPSETERKGFTRAALGATEARTP